ncbi:MAG TPA: FAD:protein FMN transferase [Polyangiales bacterium]
MKRLRDFARRLALGLVLVAPACPSDGTLAGPADPTDAQTERETQSAPPPAAPRADASATAEPPAKPALVALGREIMSTWWEIKVEQSGREQAARAAMTAALDEITRLEDVLSEWRPSSEVSRINDLAGSDQPVSIGPDTYENMRVGMQISALSGGAFDLSWAAMRGLYRFERGVEPVLPDPALVKAKRALVSYKQIAFDPAARTVRLKKKGMAIGLGGIAKGYALDRAAAILEQAGFVNYLMFAGGQVQLHGSREGRAWRIGIKHPRKLDKHIGAFEVHDGSVATAGDYEHAYVIDGRRIHHIIDPATGYPATRSASVTLVARTGIMADALDNACFIVGPERCIKMLAKLPEEGAEAVIIDPELRVFMTPNMQGRVRFDPPLVHGRLPE